MSSAVRVDKQPWGVGVGLAPRTRLLAIALVVLGVPLLSLLAASLDNSPTDLPPGWLPTGLAVVALLSQRPRRQPGCALILAIAAAVGAALSGVGATLALLQGLILALQSWLMALGVMRFWGRVPLLGRGLHHRRAVRLLKLTGLVLAPIGLLAGLCQASALQHLALVPPDLGWNAWRLGLLYGGASAVSALLFVPLLTRSEIDGRQGVASAALLLGALAAPLLLVGHPAVLFLLPVLAATAGFVGGLWLASACIVLMSGGLLAAVHWRDVVPIEGPDGFLIWTLYTWRLIVVAYLSSIWAERRAHLSPGRGVGGLVFRDIASLRASRPLRGTAHAPASLLLLSLARLPEVAGKAHGEQPELPAGGSVTQAAAARRVAAVLRGEDAVVALPGGDLLLLLPGLPRTALVQLARRLRRAAQLPQAQIRLAATCLDERAVSALLASAEYLLASESSEADPSGPAPA